MVADASDVLESVRNARFTILQAFSIALGITIVLSLFFAGTITRPVRRLARAAERVRAGGGRKVAIPDFTARNDEIGRLSAALRDMTEALWVRMDAIERFVADVAHELKNPLSSVLSAVDTARRITDEEKRAKLLALVGEDVKRLDRLLSQIADASKIDTELARAQLESVDLRAMLTTLAEMQGAASTVSEGPEAIRVEIQGDGPFVVQGVEDRLAQVLQNLVSNARSFSPRGGSIALGLRRDGAEVVVSVDDEGPGVPVGMEEAIFRRFYTLRPEGETFGTHSGLGLSISRQIAEAHWRPANLRQPLRSGGRHPWREFPDGASRYGLRAASRLRLSSQRRSWTLCLVTLSGSSWCWRAAANAISRSGRDAEEAAVRRVDAVDGGAVHQDFRM